MESGLKRRAAVTYKDPRSGQFKSGTIKSLALDRGLAMVIPEGGSRAIKVELKFVAMKDGSPTPQAPDTQADLPPVASNEGPKQEEVAPEPEATQLALVPTSSPATLAQAVDMPTFDEASKAFNHTIDIGIAQARALQRLVSDGPRDAKGNSVLAPEIDGKVFPRAELWVTCAQFNRREPEVVEETPYWNDEFSPQLGVPFGWTVTAGLRDIDTEKVYNRATMTADRGEWKETFAMAECPSCGSELRKSKRDPEYYCWEKMGGCGFTCSLNDPSVAGGGGKKKTMIHHTFSNAQLLSKATTRAIAKACRLSYSRVFVLAGMQPTPAEEMEGGYSGGSDASSQTQSAPSDTSKSTTTAAPPSTTSHAPAAQTVHDGPPPGHPAHQSSGSGGATRQATSSDSTEPSIKTEPMIRPVTQAQWDKLKALKQSCGLKVRGGRNDPKHARVQMWMPPEVWSALKVLPDEPDGYLTLSSLNERAMNTVLAAFSDSLVNTLAKSVAAAESDSAAGVPDFG